MPDPSYQYCPRCAAPLAVKFVYNAERSTCLKCGFVHFLEPKLVTVVLVQREGKYLLGKRMMNPALGRWSFISGYVDRGEQVEEAAVREVKEETNLDVRLEALIGIYSERDNPNVVVAYRASIIDDDISQMAAQPDEVSELAFFSPDEMPELAFPSDRTLFNKCRRQRER
jgi:8-oxo-dGTP diphosphatase